MTKEVLGKTQELADNAIDAAEPLVQQGIDVAQEKVLDAANTVTRILSLSIPFSISPSTSLSLASTLSMIPFTFPSTKSIAFVAPSFIIARPFFARASPCFLNNWVRVRVRVRGRVRVKS